MEQLKKEESIAFYKTVSQPCPYLEGQTEQKVFTRLETENNDFMHTLLSRCGFRRSHTICYAPSCPNCNACISVRVITKEFKPSQSHRRIMRKNAHIIMEPVPPSATREQFELFKRYVSTRHSDGDMANMEYADYLLMVEKTTIQTLLYEFRDQNTGKLVGAMLTDIMMDGMSAVYSFFDPDLAHDSLGTYMILSLIEKAKENKLPYIYLGYLVEKSKKMSYKSHFKPLEAFVPNKGWTTYEPSEE